MQQLDENFWSDRYQKGYTGWDIGSPSPPLYQYLCQIDTKAIDVLVPGAGNAYEIVAGVEIGILNIHLLDISAIPIKLFLEKYPSFPKDQVHHQNFFDHSGSYDLILEQTFFCALDPKLRQRYAEKMHELLKPGGSVVGVLFDREFAQAGPPFGGSSKEYQSYFEPFFELEKFEPCYNSIPARMGSELFIKMKKKLNR